MKKHLTLLGVAAMATSVFAGCSNDEILESYQGEEISFRTRTETRATELKKENLGDFAVYAKGVHPSGNLYTQFLIGDATSGAEVASRDITISNKFIWKLDRKVYWPSGMEHVLFWAYTTKSKDDDQASVLSSGNVSFEATGPKITGFSPAKADLNTSSGISTFADGIGQKDLLIAFKDQEYKDGTSVNINFKHALSQIQIKAKQSRAENSKDHRVVKVKGAWIVNVSTKGDLSAGFTWNEADKTANVTPTWTVSSMSTDIGHYGTFKEAITLATESQELLGNGGSLMIIPQQVDRWNKTDKPAGAYILLLCRVELKHEGVAHEGDDTSVGDVYVDKDNQVHYHQLFPVNSEGKFNSAQYGFSCVALDADWKDGKTYTYTLDICGITTGAGVYPPIISNDFLNALVPASEKNNIVRNEDLNVVGKAVLDQPIQFEVNVNSWADAGEDFNGDIPMQQ